MSNIMHTPKVTMHQVATLQEAQDFLPDPSAASTEDGYGGYDSYHAFSTGGPLGLEEVSGVKLKQFIGEIIAAHAMLAYGDYNGEESIIYWKNNPLPGTGYTVMVVE